MLLTSLLRLNRKSSRHITADKELGRKAIERAVGSVFEAMEARRLLSAVVSTDQDDYAPGSTAHITAKNNADPGTDFAEGETIHFRVLRIDPLDGSEETLPGAEPWRVADGVWSLDGGDTTFTPYVENGVRYAPDLDKAVNGGIATTWYVDPVYLGATLELKATGLTSGAVAETRFTDGNVRVRSSASGITFDLDWVEYDSLDGTGPVDSQDVDPPNEIIGFSGGAQFNRGVASDHSIKLIAPGTSNQGGHFQGWEGDAASDTFVAVPSDPTAIIVPGDFIGQRTYVAKYGTANVAPTLTRTNASVTVNEGQTASNTGTFDDLDILQNVMLTASVGTVTKTGTNKGGWSWSLGTSDGPSQGQTVTITANDGNGGITTTTFQLTVNNLAPTATVDNAGPASEGSGVAVSLASGSDASSVDAESLHYFFSTDQAARDAATYADSGTASSQLFTFADNGNHTVYARVIDKDGGFTDYQTVVTVNNVAPMGTFGNGGNVTYGGSVTASFSNVTDPSTADTSAGFRYAFALDASDLNSATYANSGTSASTSFSGLSAGQHTIYGRVIDKDGGSTSYHTVVTVDRKALTVTANDRTKAYGDAVVFGGTEFGASGLINGDSVSNVTLTSAGAEADADVAGSPYAIVASNATGSGLSNYSIEYLDGELTVNKRALTIGATADDKVYDGTTAATAHLSDDRLAGDVLTLSYSSATFANKNVGVDKQVSISGITIGGEDAGNYTFNTTATATADITARALTISATGQNKVYDGTTVATVALGDNRATGDQLTLSYGSASFNNKNVGTDKPVSVSGISIAGADAGNYTFNTTATATANITARQLTITAAAGTKIYDGTTSSTEAPSVDGLQAGDTVTGVVQTYDNKNVGTGKTLSVSAYSITDGNSGNNYNVTLVSNTAGVITQALVTGSFTAADKTYDGTTAATINGRSITSGVIAGDMVTLTGGTATFADKNVATGKLVTGSGFSLAGDDAGNYTLTSIATATASITPLSITGNITAANKTYDGTTAATILTRTLTGALPGDDVSYVGGAASFATADAGTGKTVTATGLGLLGADAANYTVNTAATTTADINRADAVISVTGYTVTYDGQAHTTTGSATGVGGVSVAGLDLSGTTHTDAGTYTDTWTFTDVTGNYNNASGTVVNAIAKANATIVVNGYTGVYDGHAHGATGTATGVQNDDLNSLLDLGASFTDVPGGVANWTFAGNGNYNAASGSVDITITKADADILVNGYTGTYNGQAHGATGSATGVNGESLAGLDLGASFTNAPGGTAAWTFTDVTGNYKDASGSVAITIGKADAVIQVTPYTVTYDGMAHTSAATATGVNGESLAGLLNLSGTVHTNAGTYADTWSFAGDTNYNLASGSVTNTINKAALTVTVNDSTRVVGQPNPAFTVSYGGFVNGETSGALGGDLQFSTAATASSGPGTYAVSASGLSSNNYQIAYVPGVMTVTTVGVQDNDCGPGQMLVVGGTNGNDQIHVTPTSDGYIVVTLNGAEAGRFRSGDIDRIVAYGLGGDDWIQIAGTITQKAWIYGDDGNDTLNLGNGGGIAFGGKGDDHLLGGGGRDILVGGDGADNVVGNAADDILIAALTRYDDRFDPASKHAQAWCAIFHQWARSDRTFQERVTSLTSGTADGYALSQATILEDKGATDTIALTKDMLNGSAGEDWFIWDASEDKVTGMSGTENNVDMNNAG